MTTYSYTVSLGTGYSSIQQAINNIRAELESGEVVEEDIIISVLDGTYPAFKIPDGCLMPLMGSVFRLIIKSAGQYFPIIDFNRSNPEDVIGADVGGANPNITIEGLKFQFFAVGIRFNLNSHNPKISKCIISNCRNVGVYIDQCSNSQVIQSVITNGDYGIVARLCKNIALVHNTIFLNGSISTKNGETVSAIWCQLANDYGNGLNDSGKLHLIGNIAWNTAGSTLSLFTEDVERQNCIISNFNNFVVGISSRFISVEDRAFSTNASFPPRLFIESLAGWKVRGFDANSKSEDPKFIASSRLGSNRSRHAIDLNLLPNSPVRGMVPSFYADSNATARWLPSYVSSSELATDILDNNRNSTSTAAGANDAVSSNNFFGSDILVAPVDVINAPDCGVNPILDIATKNYDLWYPKYNAGYFYAYDREYYLYAKKGFAFIGQLAVTKFNLPQRVNANTPILLHVNGSKVSADDYLDIVGDEAYLYHSDLNIVNGNEEIEIEYGVSNVSRENNSINYSTAVSVFKINEGFTRYFLPSGYVPRGPVVITDDMSYPTNSDLVCNREFAIQWDKQFQLAEIVFHSNKNLIHNSQFDYYPSGAPIHWSSSGAVVVFPSGVLRAVAGSNVCEIFNSGYISQELPVSSGVSNFSWYSYGTGTSRANLEVKFYDGFDRDLGYVIDREINLSTNWQRYYATVGTGVFMDIHDISEDYPTSGVTPINVPTNAKKAEFRLSSHGTGRSVVSAVQYERQAKPSYYHRVPYGNEMTVEFETSEASSYVDFNQCMSSTITTQNEGFLYISEIPASVYGGPQDLSITTLNEYRWPDGRKYYLPWARIAGKDKLRKRTINTFHEYPQKMGHVAPVVYPADRVKEIDIVPDPIITTQGDEYGTAFTINVTDESSNPFANAEYQLSIKDLSFRFPGWLHKKILGAKEQLGQFVYGKLDNGGNATVTWIPPSKESFTVVTEVPSPSSASKNGQSISFIRTKYPVNLDLNGNVTILDSNGNILNNSFDIIRGYYNPSFSKNQSVVNVEYPIKAGSVVVYDGSDILSEIFTSSPDTNQFYVDYENGTIFLKGRRSNIFIEYIPTFTFLNQSDLYKIMIYHDLVFKNYKGPITVTHDSFIKLTATIRDYTTNETVIKDFDLIASNYISTNKLFVNTAYLEF